MPQDPEVLQLHWRAHPGGHKNHTGQGGTVAVTSETALAVGGCQCCCRQGALLLLVLLQQQLLSLWLSSAAYCAMKIPTLPETVQGACYVRPLFTIQATTRLRNLVRLVCARLIDGSHVRGPDEASVDR